MSKSYLMELSTQVAPAAMFTVDGDEYHLRTLDHMSAAEEAEVTGLFQRFSKSFENLQEQTDAAKAERIAGSLRKQRIHLLTKITDMPESVAASLPASAQGKLLETLQEELEPTEENGDEGADD